MPTAENQTSAPRLNPTLVRIVWFIRLCIPLFLLRPLINRKVEKLHMNPEARDRARDEMRHLMGDAAPSDELERATDDHLRHWVWWHEMRWHPGKITRQRIEGLDNLKNVHAAGNGVLLCFVHHANFNGVFKTLARKGFHVATVVSSSMIHGIGPNTIQYRRLIESGGSLIPSEDGIGAMQAALSEGKVVASAIDVPGRTEVDFGGRRVLCSAGIAVASVRSGVPIVAATSHVVGDSTVVRLSEPLRPEDFADVDSMVQALARIHEGPVLARPSAAYLPKLAWSAAEADPGASAPND